MSFSIVLNSNNFFENLNNQQITYSYDFTNMEEGKYEVTFSYRGQQNHLNGNDLALVYVDFGAYRRVFEAGSNTTNSTSLFLGTLHNQIMSSGNDCYLYANLNDNQPVYIDAKPQTSYITVSLYNNNNPKSLIVLHDAADPYPADYVLTLQFKKI